MSTRNAWLGPIVALGVVAVAPGMLEGQQDTELPEEIERTDLLTYGQGVLFVKQSGLAGGSASTALLGIDGDSYRMGLTTDANGPVEFVYKMPSPTIFDRFAIPNVEEAPGNVTFVRDVTVSGSSDGPDDGYQELASFQLETHGPDEMVTEIVPELQVPVRWVKVRFAGGINIEEGDEGRTNVRFSELIGNGTQEVAPLSSAFDGEWQLKLTERLDLRGTPFVLRQDGGIITGCYGDARIQGTVNGVLARANGVDRLDRSYHLILVADDDGTIHASVSRNGGRFGARTAVAAEDVGETPCSTTPPEAVACGTNAFINFDVDSATIRTESEPVLVDLFRRLTQEGATQVSITGHTSTEGAEDYNLDLSRRRAQSVVDVLVARGFAEDALSAAGMGESEPLVSPDDTEAARVMNRRVEITCE